MYEFPCINKIFGMDFPCRGVKAYLITNAVLLGFKLYALLLVSLMVSFKLYDLPSKYSTIPSDYPDQFQIRQDDTLRMFQILNDKQFLGTVVNSDYGIFDFYNSKNEKEWVNQEDSLYDKFGCLVGSIQFAYYKEWFKRSNRIDIYSDKGELLAILDAEGGDNRFVFRDAKTQEPMAIALWNKARRSSLFSMAPYKLKDWTVTVVDPLMFQEKKMPLVFLVWVLLKHSQRHFPSPRRCPYGLEFKLNNHYQGTIITDRASEIFPKTKEYPDQFQIQQDSAQPLFRLFENGKILGIVFISIQRMVHMFHYYDCQKRRLFISHLDCLYENSGHCIGMMELKSDTEWLFPKSTQIKILSENGVPLATVEAEGDENCFVFRDTETHEPLATALWKCVPLEATYFPWLDYDVQSWSVTIVDRLRLQEKGIPPIYLIWALLKHSEKHFPWCWNDYIKPLA